MGVVISIVMKMNFKISEVIVNSIAVAVLLGVLCVIAFDPFDIIPDPPKHFPQKAEPVVVERVVTNVVESTKPSLAEIYSNLEESNIQVFDADSGSVLWQFSGLAKLDETCPDIKIYFMGTSSHPTETNKVIRIPYVIYFRGSGIKMFNQYIPR